GLDFMKNVRRATIPLSSMANADTIEDARGGSNELDLTMRAALDRLPAPMREAFLLKHDAGYTYDEVAAMTEATPSAVKMRVHRARETLREFLTEQGVTAA
ncbi:MAG TPA: sigma factor-like helix-turn-helix DNA-binding protein, partial [Longimicrobiales bacterium]|nr:sigma factor-like helix-turn-helix DNA-binding protein [Longimicrobiales bacterium]